MNFFKHHIGDYDSATAHLSWDEDMAYTRLMRVYYRDEKPLPADAKKIYRLVRAQSKAERRAVDAVLAEFFIERPDGIHNKRCDEEIAADRAFISNQRNAAAKRWHKNGSTDAMPAHQSGIDSAIPPTPTPTPTPRFPTPNPFPPSGEGAASQERFSNRRAEGTNPRANGSNPRATGTNPQASRDETKNGWEEAKLVWQQLIASGGANPPRNGRIQAALDAIGGWQAVRVRNDSDEPKLKRGFCERYAGAVSS